MKKISVVAVLVGAFINVVSSGIFAVPLRMYIMFTRVNYTGMPAEMVSTAILQRIQQDWLLLGFQLLLTSLCTVFAGYMAAWMAGHDELTNAVLSSFLIIALGILGTAAYFGPLSLLSIAFSPLLALLGGYLRLYRLGHAKQFEMSFSLPGGMLHNQA